MKSSLKKPVLALLVLSLVTPWNAYAYLDPGSISMAMQVVVAAVAGGFMFFRTGWTKTKEIIGRILGRKPSDASKPSLPPEG